MELSQSAAAVSAVMAPSTYTSPFIEKQILNRPTVRYLDTEWLRFYSSDARSGSRNTIAEVIFHN